MNVLKYFCKPIIGVACSLAPSLPQYIANNHLSPEDRQKILNARLDLVSDNVDSRWYGKTVGEQIALRNKELIAAKLGLPHLIPIEPISTCVYNCEFCMIKRLKTFKFRNKPILTLDDFRKILKNVSWFTTDMQFSGGEPLLNKDIFAMFEQARLHSVYTLLATNSALLTKKDMVSRLLDSPPDAMLVSYEAVDNKNYASTRRGGDLDNVRRGIELLINERARRNLKTPRITLQSVITKKTWQATDKFVADCRELGADIAALKAIALWPEGDDEYDRAMIDLLPPEDSEFNTYTVVDGKIVPPRQKPGKCYYLAPFIASDGAIIPCNYIVVQHPSFGNAVTDDFVDVWNSDAYVAYRKEMVGSEVLPGCKKCLASWFYDKPGYKSFVLR